MRNPFRRNRHRFQPLTFQQVEHFQCKPGTEKGGPYGHVVTSYQYGSHPQRVMYACPFCEEFAIIAWKDTQGRVFNRLQFSVSYLYGSILAFGGIALIVYVIYVALTSHL